MKVILRQEIKGKGGEGDVVEVARGYAVNYLLPRKLAIEATKGNLKQLEARTGNIRKREDSRLEEARSVAAMIEGKKVTIEAKVGDEGRLFGSVTAQMIEEAIASQLATNVDRRKMDVHGHIKATGTHPVTVQIYREIKADLLVEVIAEGGASAAQSAPETEAVVEAVVEDAASDEAAVEVDEVEAASEVEAEDEPAGEDDTEV